MGIFDKFTKKSPLDVANEGIRREPIKAPSKVSASVSRPQSSADEINPKPIIIPSKASVSRPQNKADIGLLRTRIRSNNDMITCLSCKRTVKVNFTAIEKKVEHRESTASLLEKFGNRGGLFLFDPSDGTLCTICDGIVCGDCSGTNDSCPVCGHELSWIGELLS